MLFSDLQKSYKNISKLKLSAIIKNDDLRYYFFCLEDKLRLQSELVTKTENISELSFAILKKNNELYYDNLHSELYDQSWLNPNYTCNMFGKDVGQYLNFFYIYLHEIREFIFRRNFNEISHRLNVFKKFTLVFLERQSLVKLKNLVIFAVEESLYNRKLFDLKAKYDFQKQPFNLDDDSIRQIYLYGKPITKDDIFLFNFYSSYSKEKLHKIAEQIIQSYIKGFKADNKSLDGKTLVQIYYSIGQERLVKIIAKKLRIVGLNTIFIPEFSASNNRQFQNDKSKLDALFLSDQYKEKVIKATNHAFQSSKVDFSKYSGKIGILRIDADKEMSNNIAIQKYSKKQEKISHSINEEVAKIRFDFIKKSETSYTIIALATPRITENKNDRFTEIFDDIVDLNLIDSNRYEMIQHIMIQQIDKASYVEILGYQGNATKLTIQLPKIPDPKTQTNFLNGGATLNIPAGELFTTPKLSGSSGTLHVKEIFLKGNKYHNLRLEFVDGLITDYNCDNFSETEDNKVFIKQNLLNNHQTLPIGEFAIGTNTTAFKIMKKHKLESVLPILITEKTGPHIAIGDPCFARSEDHPVYNLLDNKEVIARENEITSDRKTYYNCHTDITIPYDEIKYLRAISENGNVIEIIKDGKFVLAGTEILNLDYLK